MHHIRIDQQVFAIEGPQRQQAPAQCGRNLALLVEGLLRTLEDEDRVARAVRRIGWLVRVVQQKQ